MRKVYILYCEFCGEYFQSTSSTRKWHDCEQAREHIRKAKNATSRQWRERYQATTDKPYTPRKKRNGGNMKRCINRNCTNMTANYFGRCDRCLAEFERNYDIDCVAYLL